MLPAQYSANLDELFAPPPIDLSHDPIIVLAIMRGMLSGLVHPQPSTAKAMWAKGMSSSRTRTSEPVYLSKIKHISARLFFGRSEKKLKVKKLKTQEKNSIQWCPDLVYPDLVDCRDLVD